MPKFWGSIKISTSIFFRVRFRQCIFENQRWWLWLKSKSIPKVNASFLKVFELKSSIFAMHEDPSYFPIFDINLRNCCTKKRWVKRPHVVWRKRCPFRSSLFCCQFAWQYHRFKQKQILSLSHDIIHFSTTFFSNMFPNPQIRLRKTKTKRWRKFFFFFFSRSPWNFKDGIF